MGIAVSTAGMTFGYAIETTKGTRPTSGYKIVPDVKSVPETQTAPETLENTPLSNTKNKTYTMGLSDSAGVLEVTANHTEEVEAFWDELVEDFEVAKAEGLAVWFEIKHPILSKSTFFTGEPAPFGAGAAEVNSIYETKLYVVMTSETERAAKSTN